MKLKTKFEYKTISKQTRQGKLLNKIIKENDGENDLYLFLKLTQLKINVSTKIKKISVN